MNERRKLYEVGARLFKIPNSQTLIEFIKLMVTLSKEDTEICSDNLEILANNSDKDIRELLTPLYKAIRSSDNSRKGYMESLNSLLIKSTDETRDKVFGLLMELYNGNYITEEMIVDFLCKATEKRQNLDEVIGLLKDVDSKVLGSLKLKFYSYFSKAECTGDSLKLLSNFMMICSALIDGSDFSEFKNVWEGTIRKCSDFDIDFSIASMKGEKLPVPKRVENGKSSDSFGGVNTVHNKQKTIAKEVKKTGGLNTEMSQFMKDISYYFMNYRKIPTSGTVELLNKIENLSDFNKDRVGRVLQVFKEYVDEEIRIGND